jgi:hypothetical protein
MGKERKGIYRKSWSIGVIEVINLRPYLKEDIMELLKADFNRKKDGLNCNPINDVCYLVIEVE